MIYHGRKFRRWQADRSGGPTGEVGAEAEQKAGRRPAQNPGRARRCEAFREFCEVRPAGEGCRPAAEGPRPALAEERAVTRARRPTIEA